MEALVYLGKVCLYWMAFYSCYWLFLRRNTFFVWNRVYLLVALTGSFLLPFLSYPSSAPVMATAVYAVSVIPVTVSIVEPVAVASSVNWIQFVWAAYFAGVAFMGFRLYGNLRSLFSFIRQGDSFEMDGFYLYILPRVAGGDPISSFSFLNRVVLTQDDYEFHLEEIMRHELVHVNQRHSYDILLVEILQVLFWFNPILLLYKSSLQEIHEYLADREASDREVYAKFLLSYSMGVPVAVLANHFFKPTLVKERIIMLYRERNSRWLLGRYLIIIPLIATALMVTAARQRILDSLDAKRFIDKQFYDSILADTKNNVLVDGASDKGAQIIGTVTDAEGKGLEGVHVVVKGGIMGTTTNQQGRFALNDLPLNGKIVFTRVGYEAKVLPITKVKQIVTIQLKHAIEGLQEVVVVGLPNKEGGQIQNDRSADGEVFAAVEESAEYPGGLKAMYQFLADNLRYPAEAVEKKIEGKVFLNFVVTEQGYIRDVKVLKGLGYGTDEEASRVVLSMPKWKPARNSGKAVALRYNLPISFVLSKKVADGGSQGKNDPTTFARTSPVYRKDSENTSDKFSYYLHKDDTEKDMLSTLFRGQSSIPLVITDGEKYQGEVSSSALKSYMKERAIMKITVLKGHEAIDKFGEEGENGVLIMETKIE
jgi:TonB family protein